MTISAGGAGDNLPRPQPLGPIHSMIPILQLCKAHKAKYILFNDIFNDAVKDHQGNMLN